MRWLALFGVLILVSRLAAQENLNVLDPKTEPRKLLETYLLAEAKKHFDARRADIAALKTPEDVQARQKELRAKFIESLGGFPEKTSLNAQVVGREQRDGYRIEKVIYESRPNHHVTATLYLPDGKGPFPGVIMPIGHSNNGKAADYMQRGAILLARNGIAALPYDPIGQGERRQVLDTQGKPAIASSTTEHTLVTVGGILVGRQTASYRIWDGIRSLDYLASRPEIDPKRLGCTGCSGGGTLTSYLMALDERILAAAPSCYITSLERLFATRGPQDGEQNITGQVAFGMEHADYLTMRAPRPTLICAASKDFFDIQGTWTTFREAKLTYGLMGHSERVDLVESPTGHGYPPQQREAMARWMRRWLLNIDDAVTEGNIAIAKDADLQCTRTGQVLEDLKGKSVFDLNVERERELLSQRPKIAPKEWSREVRRLLGLPATIAPAKMQVVGEVPRDGYTLRKGIFETETGIPVPVLEFIPPKERQKVTTVLYLHGQGKAADAAPGGAIEKLVRSGHSVLALDPRGLGETARGTMSPDKPGHFGVDFTEAFLALHLNRPLLGQKVYDVLSVIEYLGPEIAIVGIGSAGPVALHAAALDPRIKTVTLERSLISWSNVVHTPISYNQPFQHSGIRSLEFT